MVQAASRQQTMYGLKDPISSIESVISKALRYQKYDVGELFAHSFTGGKRKKDDQLLVLHVTHVIITVLKHNAVCYLLHSRVLDTVPKAKGAGTSSRDRKYSMRGSRCSREPRRNTPEDMWEQDYQALRKIMV